MQRNRRQLNGWVSEDRFRCNNNAPGEFARTQQDAVRDAGWPVTTKSSGRLASQLLATTTLRLIRCIACDFASFTVADGSESGRWSLPSSNTSNALELGFRFVPNVRDTPFGRTARRTFQGPSMHSVRNATALLFVARVTQSSVSCFNLRHPTSGDASSQRTVPRGGIDVGGVVLASAAVGAPSSTNG